MKITNLAELQFFKNLLRVLQLRVLHFFDTFSNCHCDYKNWSIVMKLLQKC